MTALENARAWAAVKPLPMLYMRRRAEVYWPIPLPVFVAAKTGISELELVAPEAVAEEIAAIPPRYTLAAESAVLVPIMCDSAVAFACANSVCAAPVDVRNPLFVVPVVMSRTKSAELVLKKVPIAMRSLTAVSSDVPLIDICVLVAVKLL